MLQLHLLVFNLPSVAFSALDSDLLESVVVTTIVVKFFIEEMNDLVTGHIQELPGMRNDNHCAFAVADVVLEPHDGVKIQVICGFVQQKDFGLDEESSGQGDSHSPTS